MTIKEIHEALDQGKRVEWGNSSYIITRTKSHCEYQDNHFTNVKGLVLSITCESNWFGGLMDESELKKVYLAE